MVMGRVTAYNWSADELVQVCAISRVGGAEGSGVDDGVASMTPFCLPFYQQITSVSMISLILLFQGS